MQKKMFSFTLCIILILISCNSKLSPTPSSTVSLPIATKTLKKIVPTATKKKVTGGRPLKYYLAERVRNSTDFATLATWGINTAVVDFDVNGKSTKWQAVFSEAAKYNINIVIW